MASDKRIWIPPPPDLRGYTARDQERLLVAHDATLTDKPEDMDRARAIIGQLTKAGRKKFDEYNQIRELVVWDIDDFAELIGVATWDAVDDRFDWGDGTPRSYAEQVAQQEEIDVEDAFALIAQRSREEAFQSYHSAIVATVEKYTDYALEQVTWEELPTMEGSLPYEWEMKLQTRITDRYDPLAWQHLAKKLLEEEYRQGVRMPTLLESVKVVIEAFEENFPRRDAQRYFERR